METSEWYRGFAEREARGSSPSYERLALGVADDAAMLGRLRTLPEDKRQPNLLFAAARLHGAPVDGYRPFSAWVARNWEDVAATMAARSTQTNEPRRMATLLPALARLDGPLALLEVGASAGLCLYPDRWQYAYPTGSVGDPAHPTLRCDADPATPLPARVPEVVWRAGLDLNPLDVADEQDVRWLETLIWPEHDERRALLRQAVAVARQEPPLLVRGDLCDDLRELASQAPADATLVVFHSAVLAYVDQQARSRFRELVQGIPGAHWLSNEGPRVFPDLADGLAMPGDGTARFLLALDGTPLAWTQPHGRSVEWVEPAAGPSGRD